MKQTFALLVALTAFLNSAAVIQAQDSSTPPPGHNGRPPHRAGAVRLDGRRQHGPPIVAVLDANRDGTLDATELDNAPAGLKLLDKNGDGQLTREELGPVPPPPAPRPRHVSPDTAAVGDGTAADALAAPPFDQAPPPLPVMPLIQALDADADGVIDAAELANASTALLALDQSKDGQLTPDEYCPVPQHTGHPGAGKGLHSLGPRGHQPPPPDEEQQ